VNIYVETNFVLELVFEQEQCSSCEQILELCEQNATKLVIPAYSFAEPQEKLSRQANIRRDLQQSLDRELRQLSRTGSYKSRIASIQDIASLMLQSTEQEQQRFVEYRDRLLKISEIIALTANVLTEAISCESEYDLRPQDALVYASVVSHLRSNLTSKSCFLNRNSKDFDSPDIVAALAQYNCRIIPRFDSGYNFIQSQIRS
jgi:predicted nucleic acid-binding protein